MFLIHKKELQKFNRAIVEYFRLDNGVISEQQLSCYNNNQYHFAVT